MHRTPQRRGVWDRTLNSPRVPIKPVTKSQSPHDGNPSKPAGKLIKGRFSITPHAGLPPRRGVFQRKWPHSRLVLLKLRRYRGNGAEEPSSGGGATSCDGQGGDYRRGAVLRHMRRTFSIAFRPRAQSGRWCSGEGREHDIIVEFRRRRTYTHGTCTGRTRGRSGQPQ